MKPDDWWDEPITWERHLVEAAMMAGAPWFMAREAVASTMLEHPEHAEAYAMTRTRREWADQDAAL